MAEQMDLLDESMLPVRPDIEDMVRARSFVAKDKKVFTRSGKIALRRVLDDVELAEGICTALALGLSVRLIAKRFGVAASTVLGCREAMTERGELRAVRSRVVQKLERVIELGLERWEEGILDGSIHPGQITIPTLAALDKKAALDAGLVGDTGRSEAEVLLAQVKAAQELFAMAKGAATDLPSDGDSSQVVDVETVPQAAGDVATGQATVLTLPAMPAAAPVWPAPSSLAAVEVPAPVPTGAGGIANPPPPTQDQSKSFGKF